MKKKTLIKSMVHPEYHMEARHWTKYRLAYAGGREFVDKFLYRFSRREDYYDWKNRKNITYVPAYAKAAVIDVKNSIHQRLVDVTRKGGPASYMKIVNGEEGGVDYTGNSMNSFMGNVVLDELLPMKRVGIFVDKDPIDGRIVKSQAKGLRPYLYIYQTEDIRSWAYDRANNLTSLLLRNNRPILNEYGLPETEETTYDLYRLIDGLVVKTVYDEKNEVIEEVTTNLTMIPFVIPEITKSLMSDIADYQVAAMNLASADMNYSQKSNFPFYTEEYDPQADVWLRQAQDNGIYDTEHPDHEPGVYNEGTAAKEKESATQNVEVGTLQGRRYPKGTARPSFINPSPEPLRVSMEKQKVLKEEVRELINLNLASLQSRRASAESKQEDSRNKEEGLSNIGLELEYAERKIAEIWAMYESERSVATIKYPNTYSLRSDSERREEAKELVDFAITINSETLQRTAAKQAATLTLGHKISRDLLFAIEAEIDDANIVFTKPDELRKDLEAGIVDPETVSLARKYPEGTIKKAEIAHAERLARVAESQGGELNAARGNKDFEGKTGADEKINKQGRGEGK